MPIEEYKHKTICKLWELFQGFNKTYSPNGMWGMIWKAVSPAIPELLKGLDEDDGARAQIFGIVTQFAEAIKEEEQVV